MKLGVKRGTVNLEIGFEYWQKEFNLEHAHLLKIFGVNALEIVHVGSTAIPGLIAKPLIDIAVLVEELEKLNLVQNNLHESGYIERVGRLSGRQKVFAKGEDLNVTHHLHIIEKGEPDWYDKIDFKNILLSNSKIRKDYADLKIKLFKMYHNNRGEYSLQKGAFIQKTLQKFRAD